MLTSDIDKIVFELKTNNVVSIPTDTVYGLSCNISKDAVAKVINLKKRDSSKGFIIISHDFNHLVQYVDITKLSDMQINKLCSKQQQPITWIAPAKKDIQWLTGGKPTVALRLVNTDIIKDICSKLNNAIISTSANISGQEFINNPIIVNKIFKDIYVLETQVNSSQPSKIIDIITGKQVR
ncbi:translation factor Sua5 [Candidatus Francisella endociliophora]|uniref:L-threonylcarbamoyladenylate synthase n=1 Tax=Candidatus Francisella endociliophora TaxID=653937 RepID=A0A097EQ84_9GAMM|nr:L-threonylcarbamoyladenylate synthase [Francisella sp. FSC1006]AIT09733.1 translation factor Sua5 [Francisella sp. FSC1006]